MTSENLTVRPRRVSILVVVLALGAAGWWFLRPPVPNELVLSGIVTTDDVIVSPQMAGRVRTLLVAEGASVVADQVIATLESGELEADRAYYARSAAALGSETEASEAELALSIAQQSEAQANLANAKLALDRNEEMLRSKGVSQQEVDAVRTAYAVAQARLTAADRQVANRRSAVAAANQQQAAASAQTTRANVRLHYTQVTAPVAGVVDVRAARIGEVLTAGQPIVTLVNPDSLWVRADVEESYIDRVRLGDSLTVRLPSGALMRGIVIFRGLDADFATQRDVSRTKRDIKTFEIRLRVDNRDRRLAVGMTAYVLLPLTHT